MTGVSATQCTLALRGGPKAVPDDPGDEALFHWPIVTEEDEQAVLDVLRKGTMSQRDVTEKFEAEFAEWIGRKFAVGHCNGTMALLAAMHAVGMGRGDELICPSVTYWASALQAFSLGATVVFADIDPESLCLDPADIERRVTPRTKAIMVVHYCGRPADMNAILHIAKKYNLAVIEDVSHAHGALYKGKMVGTFGDVAAMSLMSGKSFAVGEAGILVTDRREYYERVIAFGHYARHATELTLPELKGLAGLPLGGVKGRMNQTCSAMGRVQLKYYPRRVAEIQNAMNRFWDLLEGVPGIRPHRPAKDSDCTMGGWYNPVGHYLPEELGGLPVETFIEAVNAEGGRCGRGLNAPLHLHPVFNQADVYHDGKPTRIAFSPEDIRQPIGSLPVSEGIDQRAFGIPYFKHDNPRRIQQFADAYRKVAENYKALL
ncbi:MAG: DegT/DnrJ/EryC1/StrS family aminotransferase [Phycisphaerae bacterium]|nr:DegT/DnrJ/EryC1/StrS family aminotransferase [Phycisphaerae bacterium]